MLAMNEHRIIIGTDRKLFEQASPVRVRHEGYARQYGRFDMIVFTGRSDAFQVQTISTQATLIPTRSYNKLLYLLDAYRAARTCIENSSFEQITISTQDPFECGIVGAFLKMRFPHINFEVQLHTDPFSPYFKKHSVLNRIRCVLASWVFKRVDRVRVVLNRVKENLVAHYHLAPEIIRVEPIAFDREGIRGTKDTFNFQERFLGTDCVLISVGRLEKEKNLFFTLKVARKLQEKGVKFKLIFIGQGSLEPQLRQRANHELPGCVEFETRLAPEDIWTYMRHAILVHASLYEGYGLVLAEAAASGGRIVAADVGVARELAESYPKLRIADYREEEFVSKIQELLS
jgi:glycosyltransferase involved in cell wall biosynthesis